MLSRKALVVVTLAAALALFSASLARATKVVSPWPAAKIEAGGLDHRL